MQYELSYTNVLNMLDLAGPRAQRSEKRLPPGDRGRSVRMQCRALR